MVAAQDLCVEAVEPQSHTCITDTAGHPGLLTYCNTQMSALLTFAAYNLQEFVHALKATSKRASREDRLRLIFAIFDVDNDGVVSAEDLELMVRQLAGRSLS